MTTTATFVGFDDNSRVSSRVLKPPGGVSSISFGYDDDAQMKPKPKDSPAPEVSSREATPSDTTSTVSEAPSSPSKEMAEPAQAVSSPSTDTPSESSSNGNVNGGGELQRSVSVVESGELQRSVSVVESGELQRSVSVVESCTNVSSNGNSSVEGTHSYAPEKTITRSASTVVAEKSIGSTSATVEDGSVGISNGPDIVTEIHDKLGESANSNCLSSVSKVKLKSETIIDSVTDAATISEDNVPSVTTSSVLSENAPSEIPSAPSTTSSDEVTSVNTKPEVQNNNCVVDRPRVSRTVPSNHHSRSSIFTGHDDEVSANQTVSEGFSSSRASKRSTPQQQQPLQRVRQPPGGFSTQLW